MAHDRLSVLRRVRRRSDGYRRLPQRVTRVRKWETAAGIHLLGVWGALLTSNPDVFGDRSSRIGRRHSRIYL